MDHCTDDSIEIFHPAIFKRTIANANMSDAHELQTPYSMIMHKGPLIHMYKPIPTISNIYRQLLEYLRYFADSTRPEFVLMSKTLSKAIPSPT